MDKRSLKIYAILIIAVIGIILIINYIRGDGDSDNETLKCITENSVLIIKEGCPACAYQKSIIGRDNLDGFQTMDCAEEPKRCTELNISHFPTWIIKNTNYEGAHSIEQLKQLTGC